MHVPALVFDLALMLLVAGVMTLGFKKLKQPLVLGYIATGFLIGPHFHALPGVSDFASVQTWSDIGVIILMFALGLEFSLRKLLAVGRTSLITAATEILGMLAVGFGLGRLMGWSSMNSIFLGAMLSMSSTTIIIKAFEDLKLKGKKFTELVFGTLVVEDIAGIFMMVVFTTIAVSKGISGGELSLSLAKMALYLILWLLLGVYFIPSLIKKAAGLLNDETLLIVSFGICFGMVLLSHYLGFSPALGAFLAGSLLAGTALAGRIEQVAKPNKDLFGAVFFISVGMMVDPVQIAKYALPILVVTAAVVVIKTLFSTAGVLLAGKPLTMAVLGGFSLAQIGEFSFIIAGLGMSLGMTGDFLYPIVVSVSVITTFTTPFIVRSAPGVNAFLARHLPAKLFARLDSDSSDKVRPQRLSQTWNLFVKTYVPKLAINVLICLGIVIAGATFVEPYLSEHLEPGPAHTIALVLILGSMAPFLRAGDVAKNDHFPSLLFESRKYHLVLFLLSPIPVAASGLLVAFPLHAILAPSIPQLVLLDAAVLTMLGGSPLMTKAYKKIERRFLRNLNDDNAPPETPEAERLGLDSQLVVGQYTCGTNDLPVQPSPTTSMFTVDSGALVIKFTRGRRSASIPNGRGPFRLRPGDVLTLLGTADELDQFYQTVNPTSTSPEVPSRPSTYQTLHDYIGGQKIDSREALQFDERVVAQGSPFAHQPVKIFRSGGPIGLLLGLKRDGHYQVKPDGDELIEPGDALCILSRQQ